MNAFAKNLRDEGVIFDESLLKEQYKALSPRIRKNAAVILLPVAVRDGVVYGMNNRTGAIVPFTFSRASGATLFDSNLDMQMVTANLPRIDFGNYAKTAKLLVERESTNMLYQSDFLATSTGDVLVGATLENTNWFGRDIRCAKLIFDEINSYYAYKFVTREVGLSWSMSSFASCGADDLIISASASPRDATIVSRGISSTNYTLYDLIKNSIYRVAIGGNNTYEGHAYNGVIKYANSNQRPTWASGYQLEQGDAPTSYIPTSGSQATRAAETLSINLPQNTEVYLKTTKQEATLSKSAGTWNIHNDIENDGIQVLAIMKY